MGLGTFAPVSSPDRPSGSAASVVRILRLLDRTLGRLAVARAPDLGRMPDADDRRERR
jgi:hypothetical protein